MRQSSGKTATATASASHSRAAVSTASALTAGSAIARGIVQAATRAIPVAVGAVEGRCLRGHGSSLPAAATPCTPFRRASAVGARRYRGGDEGDHEDHENGRVVWSASDLKGAAECEFAWVRLLDARLGRIAAVEEPEDATLKRAGALGFVHEGHQLDEYRARYGGGVVEIAEVRTWDAEALADAVARTEAALRRGADVVYQATFASSDFVGFADFLFRDPDGRYVVQDTKLARRAKVTALMQLAAYADQLDRIGIPRADRVELLLGDGTVSAHEVDDLLPVFMLRRERLRAMIASQRPELGPDGPIVAWGDPAFVACGRCATCTVEVEGHRDLLLVAGMRPTQRRRLAAAGIDTIEGLAVAGECAANISPDAFASLRTQARLQLETERRAASGGTVAPVFEVVMPAALAAIPAARSRRPLLRLRGRPALHRGGIRPLEPRLPLRLGRPGRAVRGAVGALVRRGEAGPRAVHRLRGRAPRARIRACTSTTTPPTSPRTCSRWPPATACARPRSTRCCGRACSSTCTRSSAARCAWVPRRTRSRSSSRSTWATTCARARCRRATSPSCSSSRRASCRTNGDSEGAQRIFDDIAEYNRDDCVSTLRLRDWLRALAEQFQRARDRRQRAREPPLRALGAVGRARARAPTSCRPRPGRTAPRSPRRTNARCGWPGRRSTTTRARPRASGRCTSCGSASRSACGRTRATSCAWMPTRPQVVRDWHRDDGQRTDRRHLAHPRLLRPRHAALARHEPLPALRAADALPLHRVAEVDPRRPPLPRARGAR